MAGLRAPSGAGGIRRIVPKAAPECNMEPKGGFGDRHPIAGTASRSPSEN
jgi:hypothetical protein